MAKLAVYMLEFLRGDYRPAGTVATVHVGPATTRTAQLGIELNVTIVFFKNIIILVLDLHYCNTLVSNKTINLK